MSKDIAAIIDLLAKPLEIDLYEVKYQCLTKEEGAPHNLQGFTCTSYFFKNQKDAIDHAYLLACRYANEEKLNHKQNTQNIPNIKYSDSGYYCITGNGGDYWCADLRIEVKYIRFDLNTDGISSLTGYVV